MKTLRNGAAAALLAACLAGCASTSTVGLYPTQAPAGAVAVKHSWGSSFRVIEARASPEAARQAVLRAMNLMGVKLDVVTPTLLSGTCIDVAVTMTTAAYVETTPTGATRITLVANHSGFLGSFWGHYNADDFVGRLQSGVASYLP